MMSRTNHGDTCTDGLPLPLHVAAAEVYSSDMTDDEIFSASKGHMMSLMITISRQKYDELLSKLESSERQLKALKNIYLLLQQKDMEVSSLKERCSTYSEALIASELQQCRLMQLMTKRSKENTTLNAKSQHIGENIDTGSDKGSVQKSNEPSFSLPSKDQETGHGSRVHKGLEKSNECLISDLNEKRPTAYGCLEADDAVCTGNYHTVDFLINKFESKSNRGDMVTTPKTGEEFSDELKKIPQNERHGKRMTEELGKHAAEKQTIEGLPVEQISKEHKEQVVKGPEGQMMGLKSRNLHTSEPLKITGFSQDLVTKLMSQNSRLKQVLRQVMDSQGISVDSFLEQQEYSSIVEQLREELKLCRLREKKLKDLIASLQQSDANGTTKQNLHLEETVQRQNRMLMVKQVMIEAVCQKCDVLERQVRQLKLDNISQMKVSISKQTQVSQQLTSMTFESTTDQSDGTIPVASALSLSMKTTDGKTDKDQIHGKRLDVPPSLKQETSERTWPASDKDLGSTSCTGSVFICPRCERNFTRPDRFKEHCRKCID